MGKVILPALVLCLLSIPQPVSALDAEKSAQIDTITVYYEAIAEADLASAPESKLQDTTNSFSSFLQCARALRCVACLGSLEPSCVEFNLGNWAWCLNPLNSVLLKCGAHM